MIALIYEILALVNFAIANIYLFTMHDVDWAFYMLTAIFMAVMSIKYDEGRKKR